MLGSRVASALAACCAARLRWAVSLMLNAQSQASLGKSLATTMTSDSALLSRWAPVGNEPTQPAAPCASFLAHADAIAAMASFIPSPCGRELTQEMASSGLLSAHAPAMEFSALGREASGSRVRREIHENGSSIVSAR